MNAISRAAGAAFILDRGSNTLLDSAGRGFDPDVVEAAVASSPGAALG